MENIEMEIYTIGYEGLTQKHFLSMLNRYEDLDEICALLKSDEKIALLCFEHDPDYCHRKIVAEEVKKRDGNGLKIKHIQPII